MRRFKIEIDVSKTPVDGLSYELKDGKMIIHLEPRRGTWKKDDMKMTASAFRHDLILLLGATDLHACGKLYADQPEFFAKTPVVNVDYRPENEHFGHMNAVDVTACSLGEVCHGLAEAADPTLVDARVATAFLTGIIAQTKGFRSRTVGPKHLESAGKLLAKGANRDLIVERLYRTRSVGTLRLWGRVLACLKQDAKTKLVWATLTRSDFAQSGADDGELADVIDELIASSPDAQVVALIFEARDGSVCAMVRAERPRNAASLVAPWHGTGTPDDAQVRFEGKAVTDVERDVVDGLKNALN
jgi:nanoRNase/pAp phosphatase (c-di-AMP/oligoRNAs hydrolase)